MGMRTVVALLVAVAAILSLNSAFDVEARTSLRMGRQPHELVDLQAHPPHRIAALRSAMDARVRKGNAIFMAGGYITLGAYFVNITVGTPGQVLSVLVDTGSSNTAVPVRQCAACGTGPFYNPTNSRTSVDVRCNSDVCKKCIPDGYNTTDCVFGPAWCADNGQCGYGITYGGGSSALYGSYVIESVCLADGLCADTPLGLILDQYYFTTNFNSTAFYGILGLAYPFNACNPTCVDPILQSITKQVPDFENVYGMCLTKTQGGYLDVGYIDNKKYTGVMQWVPIQNRKWYNIGLMDIKVGDHSLGLREFMYIATNDVIGAFVDSGTSLILLCPACFSRLTSVFQQYYGYLPGVNGTNSIFTPGVCIDQSAVTPYISKFPDVNFVIQGYDNKRVTLSTPATSYLMATGPQYCLGIQGVIGIGAVLGDVFMEKYYIVFDQTRNRLGFADATNCV